jgi:peptidoglycan/xylan/chitin deacetylase (PgdA/CDA1 family)
MVASGLFKTLSQQIRYIPKNLQAHWGKERFFKTARGIRILVYHGICHQDPYRFNHLFITQKKFELQLQLLKKYCNVISLEDVYAGNLSDDQFNICLTFDDGFANNYELALPLLEKYQLPATFFITAIREVGYTILWNDFLSIFQKLGPPQISFQNKIYQKNRHNQYQDNGGLLLREQLRQGSFADKAAFMNQSCADIDWNAHKEFWLQLSNGEIKKLSQSKQATIGCHGYFHNDLTKVSIPDAAKELKDAKEYLENIINKQINTLAFPYGAYSNALLVEAKNIGFTQLLTADKLIDEKGEDATLKTRLTINPFLTPAQQLFSTIKGDYGF